MHVVIELPGIQAVSRNETTGHFINYKNVLNMAEQWTNIYAKRVEHHFENQVDVLIEGYFDCRLRNVIIQSGKRTGQITRAWGKAIDTPNIDDKIFTDILLRYKGSREHGRIERPVWFIEDDSPKYLRFVKKISIPSDHYKVVITITEV